LSATRQVIGLGLLGQSGGPISRNIGSHVDLTSWLVAHQANSEAVGASGAKGFFRYNTDGFSPMIGKALATTRDI
jgi:hypothetical protein